MFFEVQDLTKTYIHNGHRFAAVDHLSFSLSPGEILAVAGESGSGKSTLCRLICQFARADSGHIFFHDQDITHVPEKERKNLYHHIQMVFQHPYRSFHPRFTLEKSILAGIHNYHIPCTPEMLRHHMEEVHLTRDLIRRYPHEVSGGECQRAALLRTYLFSGSVALLDEPFSALDMLTKKSVHDWYLKVMDEIHLSTLFITHDIDEAILLSDRIYLLTGRPGRITEELIIKETKPRDRDFGLTAEFLEYKRHILKHLERTV